MHSLKSYSLLNFFVREKKLPISNTLVTPCISEANPQAAPGAFTSLNPLLTMVAPENHRFSTNSRKTESDKYEAKIDGNHMM